jgi:hypothetical protein
MRRFGGNGLIVAAALLVLGGQAISLCLPCCSEIQTPALQFAVSGCCSPSAAISCPVLERHRQWIQPSPSSTWFAESLPLAATRGSTPVRADFKRAVAPDFLSTRHRSVSPPLLI